MKKVLVFAVLAAISLAALCGLSGCSYSGSVTYADSDKYSVGNAEITDKIENLEIDWISGSISLVSHSEDTLTLSEKDADRLPEDMRVRWWVDGDTLHVKFAASGVGVRLFGSLHKDLTLTVPETLAFENVTIRAASAEIDAAGLTAGTLSVSTASGDITVSGAAGSVELNSASGNIQLTPKDKASEVRIDTASGKIDADLGAADRAYFESASGKIKLKAASVDSLAVKATSGAVLCELEAVPSECRLHAVSGEVTLILPEESDFTADISTVSGDFESDFALKKSGSTYTCGSGGADIDIETTSGDVGVYAK